MILVFYFQLCMPLFFQGVLSPLIQGLGYSSLGLTLSISAVRNIFPDLNKKIAKKFNVVSEKLKAPTIDSNGFPLFINGVVLSGIALTAFATGDYLSSSISFAYAGANIDKGARISGNNSWTMEAVGTNFFNSAEKIGGTEKIKSQLKFLAETPPRILKYSAYLPELWGSAGAMIYGISHSGMAAAIGALAAGVAVTAAAINNGDLKNPAIAKTPIVGKLVSLSNRGENPASDQVISRRFMKYASISYGVGALLLGNPMPAMAHGCGAAGNAILESGDRSRQQVALNLN